MMRSLQAKLGSGLVLSLLSILLGFYLVLSISIRYLAEDYIYSRLSHDTETLLAAINTNGTMLELDTSRLSATYQQPFSGHYYQLDYPLDQQLENKRDTTLRSRSLWDQTLSPSQDQPASAAAKVTQRVYQVGPQNQPLLVLISHFSKQQKPVVIAVAEDLTPLEQALSVFQFRFTLGAMVSLILLISLQGWVLRRSLKPLNDLKQDLKALEQGQIEQLATPLPSELTPLVDEINHLHHALEARLTRHRNALADLAHTLKKPLTVIQQLSTDPVLESLPEIKQALARQADTTTQLIQRILNRARLAGEGSSHRAFRFEQDLPGLLDTLRMMYKSSALILNATVAPEIKCRIDREDMLELLGNLLDNACKWARHEVRMSVSQESELTIVIEDDGPGAPAEQLEALSQRGLRLDESVAGHGLGLAIVSDIVRHYHGRMTPGVSPALGGFQITLELP